MLSYDTYLFITNTSGENFGMVGLQTDNILNVAIEAFMNKKEIDIIEIKLKAKSQIILKTNISRNFNS